MTKQQFYIVWNPAGRNPQCRHDTVEAARNEATRLAEANPDQTFIVLCSIGEARKVSVSWNAHTPNPADDDLPF